MSEKEYSQFEDSEDINLKSILLKYLKYWYLFGIGLVLCIGLAFLYLFISTPQYKIQSTLLIKDDKKGPSMSGDDMFGGLDIFGSSKNVDNEIEVLKSKSLMLRVLKELSFETTYYEKGWLRNREIYGSQLPFKVIANSLDSIVFEKQPKIQVQVQILNNNSFELNEEGLELDGFEVGEKLTFRFGQKIQRPYGTFTVVSYPQSPSFIEGEEIIIEFHNLRKLANYYNQELLTVEPVNKKASVLNISLISSIPEKGKDAVNKLIDVYNKEAVEDKNLMAANTIQFIDDRMGYLTIELSEVEKQVELFKQENDLTDVTTDARLYLEQASEYNKQLGEFDIQIEVLNLLESYLKKEDNQFEMVPSSLNIQDPTLVTLLTSFNELQLERKRMLRNTQPNNPLILNINEQLANLRNNLVENLGNIKRGLAITRKNLKASSSRFESRIQKVPAVERELMEISRQQGIKRELYLYLLQKREESALSLAATVSSNSRVIDSAMAGDKPVNPKKSLVLVIACILGIGLPMGCIFIKDILNDKVQEQKDVEQATKTPILGEIYLNKTGETIVATEMNKTPIAELFRLIRTNLQFATIGKANKVIMLTSSMSGDGKTFVSINLAATLALTGKKVVIVGFDLRKPRLMQDMGLPVGMGVSNYLVSEDIRIDDILVPSQVLPNLQVIGSGPIPPNPGELMLSPRIGNLLNELKERFDYVVIDSSPVGQISDSFMLAPYIDSTIYVVRYKFTYKTQLEIINDIYKNKKLNHPMIVLNGKEENAYGGYGYGYGYEEEKKHKKKSELVNV